MQLWLTPPPDIDDPVDDFYKKYHLPYTENIIDDKQNIVVVYENVPHLLYEFKNIRRVFWWLSVDNYLIPLVQHFANGISNLMINPLANPLPKIFQFQKENFDIEHWVQSEYARQFVKLNGIPDDKIHFVGDYLNQAFLAKVENIDFSQKENQVAFNPKKGFEITQILMNVAPDINWRPIQNMTPEQVQELLAKCKVYIDFGNHPGKDRIPREAALSGCVVITGMRGSAANDVDINIPCEFKFDVRNCQPGDVINKIKVAFENFDSEYYKQKDYRRRILEDKKRFAEEVAAVCDCHSSDIVNHVAIFDLNNTGLNMASFLLKTRKDLLPTFIIDDNFSEGVHENLICEQNRNYFYIDGNNRIEIISTEDAKFLCLEGRITHLALFEPTAEKLQSVRENFSVAENNILKMNRN